MAPRNFDVISSGRDPDQRGRRPWRWWLAAAAVVLIGGGIAVHVVLGGRAAPHRGAGRSSVVPARAVPAMLHGLPPGPGAAPGTVLLLAGDELRLLSAGSASSLGSRAPVSLRWADTLLGAAGRPSPLGSNPAVQLLKPVSGGFVALLTNDPGTGSPAVGDVFFIPVTARGAAPPRLIAHANYLAVAPNGRDVWIQQAGRPARLPGATWLIDLSGRRLSPVLRLHHQVLLAATARGLLTGTAPAGGARLVSTATGATVPMRMPPGAFIAAVGADDVAWQSPACDRLSCPLHVTSLLTGADTVIALPPNTETDGEPGSFDQAGKRIALPLDTTSRQHLATETRIYIIDIGRRRVTILPGGPLPLTSAATNFGAITADIPQFNSVSWSDGPELWIVASEPAGFQAAYWPGAGPLRVLRAQPGQVFQFAVGAASAAQG